MALEKAKQIASSNPISVFSKSFCPYCNQVKRLLSSIGANYKAVELDAESDGSEIQAALHQWTGQRTVPNVFIGGKHIRCSEHCGIAQPREAYQRLFSLKSGPSKLLLTLPSYLQF